MSLLDSISACFKSSDYPPVPAVGSKIGQWERYTKPITRNITITARYSDAGINPPVKPPIETSSIDGAVSGNRTVKETVTARHSYIYTGGQLAQESITTTVTPADGTVASVTDTVSATVGSANVSANGSIGSTNTAENSTTTIETLYYAYDANGIPMSLTYTDAQGTTTTYYYATNIQGDVTAILDTTATPVVEYTYDAWGNTLTITGTLADTLGKANSLRYRGYVYDTETGLYYLQSRYYSPQMGRFINADDYPSTGQGLTGNNMFAYCGNNPIVRKDDCGAFWHIIGGAVVGAIAGGIIKAASNLLAGEEITSGIGTAMLAGAISGGLAASGVGLIGQVVGNAAISMTNNAVDQVVENKGFSNFDPVSMVVDGAIGAVAGLVGGPGAGNKGLTKYGLQVIRRSSNAFVHNGIQSAVAEASRAMAYFAKNAKHIVIPLANALRNSNMAALIGTAAKILAAKR